jgi:hypothetical protein
MIVFFLALFFCLVVEQTKTTKSEKIDEENEKVYEKIKFRKKQKINKQNKIIPFDEVELFSLLL